MINLIRNPLVESLLLIFRSFILEIKYKNKILKIIGISRIINCNFGYRNTIYKNALLRDVSLGDFSYVGEGCNVIKANIGKYCCIGPDCKIGLGKHPSSIFVSSHPIFFSMLKQAQITFVDQSYFKEFEEITIENDVWIGANVIVMDGVKIGNGAIVGAGSVVTKDVPPYAIVGGVPANIIKYRFNKTQIEKLQNIKWWDVEIECLRNNYKLFHNIEEFIRNFKT